MAVLMLVLCEASLAHAAQPRSHAAVSAFKKQQPCPATGKPAGPCPGYIVDHVLPLCAGGGDTPLNMQWQRVDEAKAKDREERAQCRALRSRERR